MYFKEEYYEYYNTLSVGDDSMNSAVVGLEDSITEVTNQFNSISLLLGEMNGEFSLEISSGVTSLLKEIEGVKTIIENELTMAINHMSSLGDNLGKLKPEDEKYEETSAKFNREITRSINRYETGLDGITRETEEYTNWINNLTVLKKSLEELTDICKKLQNNCDSDINLLKQFNDSVVDLRLKLAAVATSMGNTTIEDISNMTVEEKKKYLEKLISDITEKYNEYKKLYEYYSKDYINENCTRDQLYNFTDFYSELLGNIPGAPSIHNAFDSNNPVTRGNAIVDIIEMLCNKDNGVNGKSIYEIVSDYSGGASWKESGMDELYRRNKNAGLIDALNRYDAEELFWSRTTYGDSNFNKEIIDNFLGVVKVLDKSKQGFLDNYNKALGSAMVIKGVRGLKDSIKYDSIYKTMDFENYEPNERLLEQNGFLNDKYTLDEQKMISYLLEKEGKNAAVEYDNLRKDSINRRTGKINAQKYYESLHNGNNQGIDAVFDHIGVGVKGLDDGLTSFADGIIDLVAPDKIMSAEEYETVYFLQQLDESNDSYDKSLLTDYRIMNTVGKYTVPTLLNAFTGGSGGTALFIASDIGNGIEARQQESYAQTMSYDSLVLEQESYAASMVNAAVPYVGTDLPNDATFAVVGMFTEVNPFLGAALDVAFDQVYKR